MAAADVVAGNPMGAAPLNKLHEELNAALQPQSEILLPGAPGFDKATERWGEQAQRKPGMILRARNHNDIAAALQMGKKYGLEICVSGGGHQTSTMSSTEGGLLIDMSPMREVHVDTNTMTATVGGGAIWGDVDKATSAKGCCNVGGRVDNTGVPGLSLGGGYGWLTGRYGLVIDQIVQLKVVLADGSYVTVNDQTNQELFWAMRGAGQNFGVVTEFTFKIYKHEYECWAGGLVFEPEKLPELLEYCKWYQDYNDPAADASIGFVSAPNNKIAWSVFYDGPWEEAKGLYQPLLEIGPIMNTACTRPYPEANTIINARAPWGVRRGMQGPGYIVDDKKGFRKEFMESLLPAVNAIHDKMPDEKVPCTCVIELTSHDKLLEVSNDAMAYNKRGHHANVMILSQWLDPKNDVHGLPWAKDMAMEFQKENARTLGIDYDTWDISEQPWYNNFDGHRLEAERHFGSNLPKLRELKKKYDPENVFSLSFDFTTPQ